MARFFTPAHPPLTVPGSSDRVLRRPDFRDLVVPRPSGAPLAGEIDYDDIMVHRTWRAYHPDTPGEVRYFMYEITQRNPGQQDYSSVYYKAVRMIRLTRVPRYLRMISNAAGPNMVFEQMRDVLAALREQGVLFVNLIAKSPQLPLVFAYGVQGIGATPQEAQRQADEAYAVLDFQLSGTYQQLMYRPINLEEGELISRYQVEWGHLAMARGRPLPASSTVGVSSLLDGNRSDVESANNQLESFIRGMSDKSFLLTLVTVPLSPAEITVAWRNITEKLTEVRSETTGSRSVHAGVAFPLTMGASQGNSHTGTHQSSASWGTGTSDGTNASTAAGVNSSSSVSGTSTWGTSQVITGTESSGVNRSISDGINQSVAVGQSTTLTDSYAVGHSTSGSVGSSSSLALGDSHSMASSAGVNSTQGTSSSSSVTTGSSSSSNWNNSIGQSLGASVNQSNGTNTSSSSGGSTGSTTGSTIGDSSGWNNGVNSGSGVQGGILGFGGNTSTGNSQGLNGGSSSQVSDSSSVGSNWGSSTGSSQSSGTGASQGVSFGESYGGSSSQSASATNTTGSSQSMGVSQSLTATHGVNATQTQGMNQTQTTSTSLSQGQSLAQGASLTNTLGTSRTASVGDNQSMSLANAQGVSQSYAQSSSQSQGQSLTQTEGSNRGTTTNQGFMDGYAVAMARNTGQTGSLAVAPNFGVSISRNTFDAGKQYIGDLLEAQMRRYDEGVKSGAFLYQMFLVCPDRETALGGAGLLKSAFWGAGAPGDPIPQPFHTIVDFAEDERHRLLSHASAFTSYRKRNPYVEMIEPFLYSTYLTPTEGAAITHPPTVEGPGLLAVHDSMPVLRMPTDRHDCEIQLGYVINGERAMISSIPFGLNLDEIKNHALIAGVTGSGKTTTLMRMLAEAVKIERTVVEPATPERPYPSSRQVRASILGLDWMRNMRNLASIPELRESGRFRMYSLAKPELGAFKWNPLEVPADGMSTAEWLNAQADNFTASFNLGEFGRSLIAEFLTDLYQANRLEPYVLRPELVDESTGMIVRPAVTLPAIPREQIPDSGVATGADGRPVASAFTYSPLSRCVSIAHLATLVATRMEQLADPNAKRLHGSEISNRLQSLWRRMQYFAPGGQYERMLACDPDLSTRSCLGVSDLVNPDLGLVTIVETDGLDLEARRLVLGSVLLAIYRYGLYHGNGVFDHDGRGPGCFVVMEESHELFGEPNRSEDAYSAATRTALYESMFRRVRALGLRMVAVAQEPSKLPESVTANINNVFLHKIRAKEDRDKAFSLLNWSNMIGQNMREWRYLGEMPIGYCIARLDAREDYTESAPVQFKTEPPTLDEVPDSAIMAMRAHVQA